MLAHCRARSTELAMLSLQTFVANLIRWLHALFVRQQTARQRAECCAPSYTCQRCALASERESDSPLNRFAECSQMLTLSRHAHVVRMPAACRVRGRARRAKGVRMPRPSPVGRRARRGVANGRASVKMQVGSMSFTATRGDTVHCSHAPCAPSHAKPLLYRIT